MDKRLAVSIIGVVCVCAGIFVIVRANLTLFEAEMSGFFFAGHGPNQKIAAMSCPLAWAENKPGSVNFTVKNPLDKALTYNLRLSTLSSLDRYYQPQQSQTAVIPANQTADFSWLVGPSERSTYFFFASVIAASDEDTAKSQYHTWPSSFKGECSVRLVNSPAFTSLKLQAGGGLFAAILGCVMVYFARRPFSRRQTVVAAVIGVVPVVVVGIALFYIFGPASG